ncbi:MAG: vitamin K epoxide reductase family protein [Candidatus Cyclobacteriaceae bacterium M2_1C_046]
MQVLKIKEELRKENNPNLKIKKKLAILASIGLLDFIIISLYQLGVIRKLPDVPIKGIDSNYVNASAEAYKMGVPDGPVSATVYALILVLIGVKGTKKSGREPIWDILLGGAIAANAAGALDYLRVMIFKQKKICLYCVAGAIINLMMLKLFGGKAIKASKKMM